MRKILLPKLEAHTFADIIAWIHDTVPPWAEGAVLGMSGGIDSSVVAALTAKAFQGTGLKLRGYALPSQISSLADTTDAGIVAKLCQIPLEVVPIGDLTCSMREVLPGLTDQPRTAGNATARQRAVILWTLAEMNHSVVMGTGNHDEDYGVGYYTLTGDGLVHMNPIGFLPKRLVRDLGGELGLPERLIRREPTAGLEKDQTDAKDLGYSYEFIELVIEAMDQGFAVGDIIYHRQILVEWERVQKAGSKFGSVSEAVVDILHRHAIAEAKGTLVRPRVPSIHLPRS